MPVAPTFGTLIPTLNLVSNGALLPLTIDDVASFNIVHGLTSSEQQLSTHIHTVTHGAYGWAWDFLVGLGRHFLVIFSAHARI